MQRTDTKKSSSHCQIEPFRLPPRGANVADGTEGGTKDRSLTLRTQALTTLGISWKPDSSAKTIWGPTAQPSFEIWTVFFLPVIDLCFIPLQRTPFWLLGAPSQAVHQAPDMVPVVAHTKLALDHLGNARRGPQIGPVILRHRSLEQQGDQTLSLGDYQLQGTAWREAHLQCVKAAVPPRIPPAHHRTRIASDLPPNFVER